MWPNPDGLEFHVLFGSEGDLRVSEIWDSQEQFQAFGELQQWLKTSLAVAGARERLPKTRALAERPIPENLSDPRRGFVEAVREARVELLAALQRDGDLAAAGKRLE